MIPPLWRHQQQKMAGHLLASLRQNAPPVVHLVRFPQLSINHAVLLFAARETDREIEFTAYDPNLPDTPVRLVFNRALRRFSYPAVPYFAGGRVDVYEIYCTWAR